MDDRRLYKRRIIPFLSFCLILSLNGCATVNVASVGETGYAVEEDEQRIFNRAKETVELLDDSGYIYPNVELEEYITRLVNSLCTEEVKEGGIKFRAKVLKDPSFNAFAFPSGQIYVHTGMLALMDNEAQLLTMLGHEMTHVIQRHALKQFRSMTNKSAFMSTLTVASGPLGSLFIQMAVISSVYGYSQSHESESDSYGFAMLEENGYDTRESVKLFSNLEQHLKDEKIKSPLFFSSHPKVRARRKNYEKLITRSSVSPEGKRIGSEDFESMTNQLVMDNAKLCLHQGMFLSAEKNIRKYIKNNSWDPQGYYFLGEFYRQRQDKRKGEKIREKEEDYEEALDAYKKSIELDARFALGYKGQGQIYRKQKKDDAAKEAYITYLSLEPLAKDKLYIEQYLKGK